MVTQRKITFCRICEATCGLQVDVEDNRIVEIKPDREHVVSQGYACVKGTRYASIQHSPDRILNPMKRVGNDWHDITWSQSERAYRRSRSADVWSFCGVGRRCKRAGTFVSRSAIRRHRF
jgi:anaerobic selenocysteine-containing dehydrogenase